MCYCLHFHQLIQEVTGVNRASDEIRCWRWGWIGHKMRKNREENCVTALEWRPDGKRRPKTIWRAMVEDKRQAAGWQSQTTVRALATNQKWCKDNAFKNVPHSMKRYRDRYCLHFGDTVFPQIIAGAIISVFTPKVGNYSREGDY